VVDSDHAEHDQDQPAEESKADAPGQRITEQIIQEPEHEENLRPSAGVFERERRK